MEEILNETGTALRHLRCGLFMENFLSEARSTWEQGMISYPIAGHILIPLTSAEEVEDTALRWLVRRDWQNIEVVSIHGRENFSLNQAARSRNLGEAGFVRVGHLKSRL
jgi:hypothetical protein